MSNERTVAKQLTDQFLKFLGPVEDPSLSPEDQAQLKKARNKLFTAMLIFTRVDPLNTKLAAEEVRNLPRPDDLKKVYAAMEQQIRHDIAHPSKENNKKKDPPPHVYINTIEFNVFKQELRKAETDPFK